MLTYFGWVFQVTCCTCRTSYTLLMCTSTSITFIVTAIMIRIALSGRTGRSSLNQMCTPFSCMTLDCSDVCSQSQQKTASPARSVIHDKSRYDTLVTSVQQSYSTNRLCHRWSMWQSQLNAVHVPFICAATRRGTSQCMTDKDCHGQLLA